MTESTVNQFDIIGISVRTTNENNQAVVDIANLWHQFMADHLLSQIPNRIDDTIYSVYTDYDKDYTKPYTTILGCKVRSLDKVPAGFVGRAIAGGKYLVFTANGKLAEGVVFKGWSKIWNTEINRAYTADFEVYGAKAQDPNNVEIDIFVSVN